MCYERLSCAVLHAVFENTAKWSKAAQEMRRQTIV